MCLNHIRIKGEVGAVKHVKPSSICSDRFMVVLLLWIIFIIYVSCFVFVILSCLLLAALWSPVGKGLTSWLSCVWCFLVFLSLSHVVSRAMCGTWLYRFLIIAFFFTLSLIRCWIAIWNGVFHTNMFIFSSLQIVFLFCSNRAILSIVPSNALIILKPY